ncbi:MAG TPA: DNA gyrase inhibitor YacG [Terriglobales bacterium]|nr:DNA gyrase inhibitor YacG [Terriglobales bacterium]
MTRKRTLRLRCPTCKKTVKSSDPEFPFCSERCRVIDLGKWASGAYIVSSPLRDTSDISSEVAPEDDRQKRKD